jgi:hypothetical protein
MQEQLELCYAVHDSATPFEKLEPGVYHRSTSSRRRLSLGICHIMVHIMKGFISISPRKIHWKKRTWPSSCLVGWMAFANVKRMPQCCYHKTINLSFPRTTFACMASFNRIADSSLSSIVTYYCEFLPSEPVFNRTPTRIKDRRIRYVVDFENCLFGRLMGALL